MVKRTPGPCSFCTHPWCSFGFPGFPGFRVPSSCLLREGTEISSATEQNWNADPGGLWPQRWIFDSQVGFEPQGVLPIWSIHPLLPPLRPARLARLWAVRWWIYRLILVGCIYNWPKRGCFVHQKGRRDEKGMTLGPQRGFTHKTVVEWLNMVEQCWTWLNYVGKHTFINWFWPTLWNRFVFLYFDDSDDKLFFRFPKKYRLHILQ